MKIIVTHSSPDLDAITSVWLLKKFLSNWENAAVKFVPAGEIIQSPVDKRLASDSGKQLNSRSSTLDAIEKIGKDEVIHVDTGMGPLDHHQIESDEVCAATRTLDFVMDILEKNGQSISKEKKEALGRMVKVVVDVDHFKEVFWKDATSDYHEFSFINVLDGFRLMRPNEDSYYIVLGMEYLDAILHEFENRIWAEKEIAQNGKKFDTRFGPGIGFETINDSVIKLSQKMGYVVVVRRDPRKGYVRIKARPSDIGQGIDLTLVYEKLRKMDPSATWYLHISKKMLLNGSAKNPRMRPTKLKLSDIIEVLREI